MSEEMKLSGMRWSHARRDLAMSIAVVVVVVGIGYKLGVIGCQGPSLRQTRHGDA